MPLVRFSPGKSTLCSLFFSVLSVIRFSRAPALSLCVLIFFVPSRLDGLENSLVRLHRVSFEVRQLHHPFVQIGEADGIRVRVREHLLQLNCNVFRIRPVEFAWHACLLLVSVYRGLSHTRHPIDQLPTHHRLAWRRRK